MRCHNNAPPRRKASYLWFTVVIMLIWAQPKSASGELFSEVYTRLLPDSSFAAIETDAGGRTIRRCPYRHRDGRIEMDQLIHALATLESEDWIDENNREAARKLLVKHYRRYAGQCLRQGPPEAMDLNTASLHQLVRLPGIGPFLAVRIAEYRQKNDRFFRVEDITKVPGISRSTYFAIRAYLYIW